MKLKVSIEGVDAEALLRDWQTSSVMGTSVVTLSSWRSNGVGPKVTRVGRTPMYRVADIIAWLENEKPWVRKLNGDSPRAGERARKREHRAA